VSHISIPEEAPNQSSQYTAADLKVLFPEAQVEPYPLTRHP